MTLAELVLSFVDTVRCNRVSELYQENRDINDNLINLCADHSK